MEAPTPPEPATHLDAVNAPRWQQALAAFQASKLPTLHLTGEEAKAKARAFEQRYVVKREEMVQQ
jgi:hypothetical protein